MIQGEPPLLVFISSVMSAEDLASERETCVRTINSLPLTRAWAFEYSPASSAPPDAVYMDKVARCDMFVLILGAEMTDPVENEYRLARDLDKPRLVFIKSLDSRTDRAASWLAARHDVKWGPFDTSADLAVRLKSAICDELVKAYRLFRLSESDLDTIASDLQSQPVSFLVRTIESRELGHVTETLPELQSRYPDFREWISAKALDISRGDAEALVASIGSENAGFALVSQKGPAVQKVSTLLIRERFRNQGVGGRLLFAIVERAARNNVEKLYITFSEELRDQFEPLLERYGFYAEGVSGRRYRRGSWEWIWGKRLLYGRLRPPQLRKFVEHFFFRERGFATEHLTRNSFLAHPRYGVLGQTAGQTGTCLVVTTSRAEPDGDYGAARAEAIRRGAELVFVTISPLSRPADYGICLDALDLETRFFPMFVEHAGDGLIVPIREVFAQRLVPRSDEPHLIPTRVQIRTDNAYYRYPSVYAGLRRGSPLFFYETQRTRGASRLIGEAKVLEYAIGEPEDLVTRYGSLGVFTLDVLRSLTPRRGTNAGKALALRFDWYREIPAPLTCSAIRNVLPNFDPTTARRLQPMDILELRRSIGWDVNALSLQ